MCCCQLENAANRLAIPHLRVRCSLLPVTSPCWIKSYLEAQPVHPVAPVFSLQLVKPRVELSFWSVTPGSENGLNWRRLQQMFCKVFNLCYRNESPWLCGFLSQFGRRKQKVDFICAVASCTHTHTHKQAWISTTVLCSFFSALFEISLT